MDGWYWCPEVVIEKRIADEEKRLKGELNLFAIALTFSRWKRNQQKLEARLAHACSDGKIRATAGWGVEYFTKVGGVARIYGKCRFCDEALSDGIKCIILMELAL